MIRLDYYGLVVKDPEVQRGQEDQNQVNLKDPNHAFLVWEVDEDVYLLKDPSSSRALEDHIYQDYPTDQLAQITNLDRAVHNLNLVLSHILDLVLIVLKGSLRSVYG